MRDRPFGTAIGAVEVDGSRRIGAGPRPIVPGIDPQPTGPGPTPSRIEHRDRRVVGEQLLRSEHVLGQPGSQRLQPPGSASYPVGQGRTIELHALAGEHLRLPIEGKMVAVLADQDLGQQAGGRQPLGDGPLRRRYLMDAATGPATILRPADPDDAQAGRHPVQHLAHRLAGIMQDPATARAGLRLEVEVDLLALQMLGQTGSLRSIPCNGHLGTGHGRQQLLDPAYIGTDVFQTQLQLVAIQPLGPSAELQALQLLHDQPQPLDLGLGFGEGSPFARPIRRKIPDQSMQRIDVLGQSSKVDVHPPRVRSPVGHRIESSIAESIGRNG